MKLQDIQTKFKNGILLAAEKNKACEVRVFGSVVNGSANDASDIDFVVKLKRGASLLDLSGLRIDLEKLLKCKVDVVPENSLHRVINKQVLQEAVRL